MTGSIGSWFQLQLKLKKIIPKKDVSKHGNIIQRRNVKGFSIVTVRIVASILLELGLVKYFMQKF